MGGTYIHPRQKKILTYLMDRKTWAKGREVAAELGVTDRTVRNDVACINSIGGHKGDIIDSSIKMGYRIIDYGRAGALLTDEWDGLPENQDERVNYILKKLMFEKKEIDIYELADEIKVSAATIENDFKKVREIIGENGRSLMMVKKSCCIYLKGSEKDKRSLLSELLFKETKGNFFNVEEYRKYFNELDLNSVQRCLMMLINKYDYTLNEMAIVNLIIHIAITIDRIKRQDVLDMSYACCNIADTIEYKIARELCDKLEKEFDMEFPPREVLYISYLILGKRMLKNTYSNRDELRGMMEPYFLQLTESLLNSIRSEFGLELMDDDILFIGLCLHIRAMYDRIKNNMVLRNPLLEELKRKYPFIFEITVFFASEFNKITGLYMDEDEMGYIALHLGAAFERLKDKSTAVKRVALVCPAGYTTSSMLMHKLNSIYGGRIEIVGVFSFMEINLIDRKNPDLIITTVPFNHNLQIKTIVVSPFLNEGDINKINTSIDLYDEGSRKSGLMEDAGRFFSEDLFYKGMEFADEFQAIHYMAGQLYKKGYVPEDYPDLVIQREKLSSTSFGNLMAIPHPIIMNAYATVISTAILDKPIIWGSHKVQLILMFAIKSGDRKKLNELYDHVVDIVDRPGGVNYLIKSKSFDDFKMRLVNCDPYDKK